MSFYISFLLELMALAAGLIYYKRMHPAALRLLVPFLLITCLIEGFAYFGLFRNSGLNKNYFYAGFFLLQLYVFWRVFVCMINRDRYIHFLNLVFSISLFLSVFTLSVWGAEKLNPYFLNVVCLCMISYGFAYYYLIYNSRDIRHFRKEPLFWISTGIIFVNFIHLLFVNVTFIESFRRSATNTEVFKILNSAGNLVYYSCIIYGFICSSKFLKQAGT